MTLNVLRQILSSTVLFVAIGFSSSSTAAPPNTPSDFNYVVYSETAAELFWQRSTNVLTQGYEITRNGESLGVFDALSFFDNTLSPGVEYTYTIIAIGLNGEISGTSTVSLVTPQSLDTIASLQRDVASLEQEIARVRSLSDVGIPAPVPRTGQTDSLQFGDDGDYQAGIAWPDPRFNVNVNAEYDGNANGVCDNDELCNGSITDNLTGLTWLQNANCFGELDWSDAISAANNLAGDGESTCGLTDNSISGDWRVPNIKEILSLMDYGHDFPTALLPADHSFTDVQLGGISAPPSSYWTSTSTGTGSDGIYSVSLSVGWVERLALGSGSLWQLYVLPVRGGF